MSAHSPSTAKIFLWRNLELILNSRAIMPIILSFYKLEEMVIRQNIERYAVSQFQCVVIFKIIHVLAPDFACHMTQESV